MAIADIGQGRAGQGRPDAAVLTSAFDPKRTFGCTGRKLGDRMYFALSADDLMLHVFPTVTALADYCEGCGVESDGWLFWDQRGAPLQARFTEPVHRSGRVVGGGIYVLEAGAGRHLVAALHRVTALESDASFRSVEDVRTYLGG